MTDYFSNDAKEFKNIPGANQADPASIAIAYAKSEHQERIKKRIKEDEEYIKYADDEKLASISEEINHKSFVIKFQIFEIGRLLCEAKKYLGHGAFKSWIKANLRFSYSSAVNIRRVYTECVGVPEMLEYYNVSRLYEICSPKFPGELREYLLENAKHGGFIDASKKDLIVTILKFRDGEIDLQSPEIQNMLKNRCEKIEKEKCKIEIKEIENFLKIRAKRINGIESDHHINNPLIENFEENYPDSPKGKCIAMIDGLIGEIDVLKQDLEKM